MTHPINPNPSSPPQNTLAPCPIKDEGEDTVRLDWLQTHRNFQLTYPSSAWPEECVVMTNPMNGTGPVFHHDKDVRKAIDSAMVKDEGEETELGKPDAKAVSVYSPRQKWLPIESAPKDGRMLDLWFGRRETNCYWGKPDHSCGEAGPYCDSCPDHDGWCATDGFIGYLNGADGIYKAAPTHWMQIPAAPSVSDSNAVQNEELREEKADVIAESTTRQNNFILFFNHLAREVYENAKAKGWWDVERNNGEMIALMHSELSEALEADRNGNPPDDKIPEYLGTEAELADVVIRIMDMAHARQWRVAEAIITKMEMNEGRPNRHGGKAF